MRKLLNRQPDRGIGHPTLIETTVDERTINASTPVNLNDFSISSRPAFGRKATQDVLKGLPELPFKSLQVPSPHSYGPNSETQAASSVYSQPSPDLSSKLAPELDIMRASSMYEDDVSPPDSIRGKSQRSSSDVSPIEAPRPLANRSLNDNHWGSSNISLPKNPSNCWVPRPLVVERRDKGASLPIRDSSLTTSTRWDDFSGEPTTSEKAAHASLSPVNFGYEPSCRRRSGTSGYHMGNIETGSQNRRRLSNHRADNTFGPREEWKGASGRHAIINPLQDKPLPRGLVQTFPPGTQKALDKPLRQVSSNQTHVPSVVHTPQYDLNQTSFTNNRSITPLGFINTGLSSSSGTATPIRPQKLDSDLLFNTSSIDGRAFIPDNSKVDEAEYNPFPTSLGVKPAVEIDSPEVEQGENEFRAKMQKLHLEDQPPSRFSATTYATTEYDSPPVTPEMNYERLMSTPPLSILHRKRPVPAAGIPGAKATARKPTPSDIRKSTMTGAKEKNLKMLPMSPPEAEAVTRVASLEAKLENLRRRRYNLKTVIHELTYVVQPSSIAYDMASRQEIKKTVDGLNKELLEVVKEEHETGLQLHRAWKREDETSAYENSSLWVRRLAS